MPGRGQGGDRRQHDVPRLEELAEGARGAVEHGLHLRAFGEAGAQPGLPDAHADRFDHPGRRALQALGGKQVGDGLREVADVAGGLRGEGGAVVHWRHLPFDMMAQAFQQPAHPFQLGRVVRGGAVLAPFVRQRDAQPARVALDQLQIGLGRRPVGHELARRAAAALVDEGRGVAHRAADAALRGHQPGQVGQLGRDGEHAARRLQADQAVGPGGDADRAAPVGGVGQRQHTGGDRAGRAGRRAQRGVVEVPGVSGDVDRGILGRRAQAELRRGGAPDQVQSRAAHPAGEEAVLAGAVAAHEQRAHFLQPPAHGRAQVLEQEGHAGEEACRVGASLEGVGHRVVEELDHGTEPRVEHRDAGRCLRGQFGRMQFASAYPLGQGHGIVRRPFVPTHRQAHAIRSIASLRVYGPGCVWL